MFGLKRNRELHEVMADTIPHSQYAAKAKQPQPMVPVFGELDDLSEYMEVAKVLGFNPPQIEAQHFEKRRREIIGFMLDQGFPIYDNKEVHEYMTKLAKAAKQVFVWADVGVESFYEMRDYGAFTSSWTMGGQHRMDTNPHGARAGRYQRPIPLDILKRAAAVKKQFADVSILVSDYAVPTPDPFICAKLTGCEHVIFGVWDEPGFKAIGRDVK